MVSRVKGEKVWEGGEQTVLRGWNISQMDHGQFGGRSLIIREIKMLSSVTPLLRCGLGAPTFHISQCRSHLGESLPLEPRSKSWQNPLTAGSRFEEGEVGHDLIKRENFVNYLKISLGTGNATWFSLR